MGVTEATWAAWQSLDDLERGQGAWEPQRCAACALSGRCRRESADGPEGGYCAWYENEEDERERRWTGRRVTGRRARRASA